MMSEPFAPVTKVDAAATVRVPLSVISPAVAVAANVPVAVFAPRIKAFASTTVMFAPVTDTAPVKSCVARSRTTSNPVASIVVVASISRSPLSDIAPPAVSPKAAADVMLPKTTASVSST